ncbi:IS110 family transposase [Streptacidiphilus monticola]
MWLVNARDVKNVPGRPKTDRLDAIWLAKLNERGMLRASFVPARPIRELRDLTRTRAVFIHERTRHKQRVEKLLEDAQIKLSSAISDLFGQSGRAILDALADGERRPAQLAALAVGNLRYKQDKLRTALVGQFTDHHGYLLTVLLTMVDTLTAEIDRLTTRIEQHLADTDPPTAPPATGRPGLLDLVDRIDEIPGVGPRAAQIILAEIGPDMTVFPTAGHLASWAKLSPAPSSPGRSPPPAAPARATLAPGRPRRSRRIRRPHRHLPRHPLQTPGQTPRPPTRPGRRRPLHPRHHLAPRQRPHRPLPRPRTRLAHPARQPTTQDPRPRPPTRTPRPPRHPRPSHPITPTQTTNPTPDKPSAPAARPLPPALPQPDFPFSSTAPHPPNGQCRCKRPAPPPAPNPRLRPRPRPPPQSRLSRRAERAARRARSRRPQCRCNPLRLPRPRPTRSRRPRTAAATPAPVA